MRFPTTANKYLTISNNTQMGNIQVSNNIYTAVKDTYDNNNINYNINIKPNLWCRFETGALTTNNGTDAITLTNNGTAANSGFSMRGNNSLLLNGTSQYLTGTIEGIANNSWSVSAWLFSKSTGTGTGCCLSFGNTNTAFQIISIGFGISTLNCYTHNDLNTEAISSAFAGDVNNWVHLTFMFNSATKERIIYRNGVKLTLSGTIIPNGQYIPNNILTIEKIGSTGYFYNGHIDDLRVYTGKVLTQEEITAIYNDTSVIYNYAILENYWNKSTINTNDIYYIQNNVGIGTNIARYKLDVIGDVNITGNYYQNNTALSYSGTGTYIFSDSRIKTNIIDINDDGALQQILKIEPKIYNYIDTTERGTDTVYGFIAQQIREFIPEAVKIQTDFIPNIYKYYDYYDNQINTNEDLTAILGIGDKIKIKDNCQDYYRTATIINITTTIIMIDLAINSNRCFIYGKEINDFHYLDKSYIYTLGVCATQDLYKMFQKLNDKYEQQQIKIRRIKELLSIRQ